MRKPAPKEQVFLFIHTNWVFNRKAKASVFFTGLSTKPTWGFAL